MRADCAKQTAGDMNEQLERMEEVAIADMKLLFQVEKMRADCAKQTAGDG